MDNSTKDGALGIMHDRAEYHRAYYGANRGKIRAYGKAYHAANRDRINSAKRSHRAANPEENGSCYGGSYQRGYRFRNKKTVNGNQRRYRSTLRELHPEKFFRIAESNAKKLRVRLAEFKEWTNSYKAERGCIDCRIGNPIVLDFDHRAGTVKIFDIANGAQRNRAKVLEEIAKCDVRCSNCHRIKTHERRLSLKQVI